MKRVMIFTGVLVVLLVAVGLLSQPPAQGQNNGQSEVQRGFAIAPVNLNLQGKNHDLVGLGSYIINAQGAVTIAIPALHSLQGTTRFRHLLEFPATG